MMTLEEESLILQIIEGLENANVKIRLIKILEELCEHNSEEVLKNAFFKLKNFHKEVKKQKNETVIVNTKIYQKSFFDRLIEEIYQIAKSLELEQSFLSSLEVYLNSKDITYTINLLTIYNDIHQLPVKISK